MFKAIFEFFAKFLVNRRLESRADFDAVASRWEALADALNHRMTEAFSRIIELETVYRQSSKEYFDMTMKFNECERERLRLQSREDELEARVVALEKKS